MNMKIFDLHLIITLIKSDVMNHWPLFRVNTGIRCISRYVPIVQLFMSGIIMISIYHHNGNTPSPIYPLYTNWYTCIKYIHIYIIAIIWKIRVGVSNALKHDVDISVDILILLFFISLYNKYIMAAWIISTDINISFIFFYFFHIIS